LDDGPSKPGVEGSSPSGRANARYDAKRGVPALTVEIQIRYVQRIQSGRSRSNAFRASGVRDKIATASCMTNGRRVRSVGAVMLGSLRDDSAMRGAEPLIMLVKVG
jgi:hypothetical protein